MAIEPEDLLPHFEREMALMRRSMRTFAGRYPKIAARLAITGDHSEDPHVERLLQSFALLAAYHDTRLEDDVPAFTRSLLETAHGAFLRPFPSCAIAQFDPPKAELTELQSIPRGTACVAPVSRVSLSTTRVRRWMPGKPASAFVSGLDITLDGESVTTVGRHLMGDVTNGINLRVAKDQLDLVSQLNSSH